MSKWIHVRGRCLLCQSQTLQARQYANGLNIVRCKSCKASWESVSRSLEEVLQSAGISGLDKLEEPPSLATKNRQGSVLRPVTA